MPITSWKGVLGPDRYRPKYPDSPFIHIADLVNKETGKTYREENAEKKHAIPIGALVEIVDTGVRLFVVQHGRDCDMTPLYELCADKDDVVERVPGFRNMGWTGGYSEESLKVVRFSVRQDEFEKMVKRNRKIIHCLGWLHICTGLVSSAGVRFNNPALTETQLVLYFWYIWVIIVWMFLFGGWLVARE